MKLLSKMSRDELWAFWVKYQRASRNLSLELLGRKYAGYTNDASSLASYACNRAVMIDCRRRGDRVGVRVYELCAETCLEGLSVTALSLVYDGTGR